MSVRVLQALLTISAQYLFNLSGQKYPKASIKMLSNSRTQKIYIDDVCKEKGFGNVEVITGDFTKFDFEEKEQ
jgi:hypothetical protein